VALAPRVDNDESSRKGKTQNRVDAESFGLAARGPPTPHRRELAASVRGGHVVLRPDQLPGSRRATAVRPGRKAERSRYGATTQPVGSRTNECRCLARVAPPQTDRRAVPCGSITSTPVVRCAHPTSEIIISRGDGWRSTDAAVGRSPLNSIASVARLWSRSSWYNRHVPRFRRAAEIRTCGARPGWG
jgi:hypothetical protein